MSQNVPDRLVFLSSYLCMVSLGSLEALRQWLGSTDRWMFSLGSQVALRYSKVPPKLCSLMQFNIV